MKHHQHHANDPELRQLLVDLRAAGVQCRTILDEMKLVWKPRPSLMDPELAARIEAHLPALTCILVPERGTSTAKPFWFGGPLVACVGCGVSTAARDPLGQPRHWQCGWLYQPKVRYSTAAVVRYPQHLTH